MLNCWIHELLYVCDATFCVCIYINLKLWCSVKAAWTFWSSLDCHDYWYLSYIHILLFLAIFVICFEIIVDIILQILKMFDLTALKSFATSLTHHCSDTSYGLSSSLSVCLSLSLLLVLVCRSFSSLSQRYCCIHFFQSFPNVICLEALCVILQYLYLCTALFLYFWGLFASLQLCFAFLSYKIPCFL